MSDDKRTKVISFLDKKKKKAFNERYSIEFLANYYRQGLELILEQSTLEDALNCVYKEMTAVWLEYDPTVTIDRFKNMLAAYNLVKEEYERKLEW